MRTFFIVIFLLFLNSKLFAQEKNNFFNKRNIILVGLTISNPAISIGTVLVNTGSLQKIISVSNLAYTSIKGKSIAEEALSKTIKKDCLLKNLANNKELCL